MTRETANDVHQLVTGVGRVAVAFRVGSQSDPGGAAQRSYEGRLTTVREMISTVWIERSRLMKERTESIPEAGERNGGLRDSKWGAVTIWQSAIGS